ncbi:MAG: DUF1501 domain-containing protein [Pirellulaceae bacterium]
MLTISDRISRNRPLGRRHFMQLGGMGLGSLALPLLGARAGTTTPGSPVTGKSVIFLFQQGGPTQFETFDPKVDVSSAIASVGGDMPTSVPGTRFGTAMEKLAKHAHRMAVVRNYQTNMGHGGVNPVVSPHLGNANIGAA